MKRFMETNVITHNLMSFSGFKSLLIFTMLTKAPRTYNEIREELENNEYLRETVSIDTIRIYMKSLEAAGCNIKKINIGRTVKYYIDSNPFELKISDNQIKSIIKVYKAISKSIDITDFLTLQNFFDKISPYITNQELKTKLKNISPISNIKPDLINNLLKYTQNNIAFKMLYHSKTSGDEEIDIIPDKMNITNGKLYISGYSSAYNNYSAFLVSDIRKIINVNLNPEHIHIPEFTVRYEYLKNDNPEFLPQENEVIIDENKDNIVVKITSQNKFLITQRILSMSNKCRVISPDDYREEIISGLKKMKENYIEQEC